MLEQSILKSPDQFAHQELAQGYFEHDVSSDSLAVAEATADSFEVPGKPLGDTIVFIPVLAHQDHNRIYHAMEQYSRQRNCQPFSILLYLNVPHDELANPHIETAYTEVERAQRSFPGLDIRTAFKSYDHAPLGRIRADCWNGGALLAMREGKFRPGQSPVIGLNNDIDTEYISPFAIRRVQQHYQSASARSRYANGQLLLPTAIRVDHHILPSHPNVGAVTAWKDESISQYPEFGFYEAGLVVSLDYYMEQGGFKDCIMGEAVELVKGRIDRQIAGAHILTAPRRYIDRLAAHTMEDVWTADSFGMSDTCRERLPPDIDFARAEEVITETLPHDMYSWLARPILVVNTLIKDSQRTGKIRPNTALYKNMHTLGQQMAEGQVIAAQSFMRQTVGSVALARCLPGVIDYQSHVSGAIDRFFETQKL